MCASNLALYKTWAPDSADWTIWAKPVLFNNLSQVMTRYNFQQAQQTGQPYGMPPDPSYPQNPYQAQQPYGTPPDPSYPQNPYQAQQPYGTPPNPSFPQNPYQAQQPRQPYESPLDILYRQNAYQASPPTLNIPEIPAFNPEPHTMIIVDSPGKLSVEEALAFAKKGYRPVPLYNGVRDERRMMAVDVNELCYALFTGVDILRELNLLPYSPPVFMLDSNRMNGSKASGLYDNRWSVFPQDVPSAEYLKSKGIDKIILRSHTVADDLERILYGYKKEGMRLFYMRSYQEEPIRLNVRKRSGLSDWAYRFKVILGLSRNSAGGFGSIVPEPSQSSGGYHRHYRHG